MHRSEAAMSWFHSVPWMPMNADNPTGSVYMSGLLR